MKGRGRNGALYNPSQSIHPPPHLQLGGGGGSHRVFFRKGKPHTRFMSQGISKLLW